MDFLYTGLLVLILLLSVLLGWALRSRLDERHVSLETVDSARLLMTMLLTFAALVLGLLTSDAKNRFDVFNNNLSAFGTELIELDHRLRVYGPEANGIRTLLRSYTAAAIADSWPGEPLPSGQFPHLAHGVDAPNVEAETLGDMLAEVDVQIGRLVPQNEFQRQTAERLRNRVTLTIEQRWILIFSTRSTISWPFLIVLTSWLSIVFAIFGLTSPRNRLIYAVVGLAALSIASPLYLIIDYSGALTGLLHLSSLPMRAALSHMDRAI